MDGFGGSSEAGQIFADRLLRAVPALSTQAMRVAYLRSSLGATTPVAAAQALESICERASRGEACSREVLVSVAGLLQEAESQPLLESLRQCAEQHPFPALARLLWRPSQLPRGSAEDSENDERRVPDYGRGRALTLGERKALARRPRRDQLDNLLADPHPAVIHNLLNNSITTETDVIRLAARRPLQPVIMTEIARHPRWNVRQRVRMALLLNPNCPPEIGIPLVGLLLRSELRLLVSRTDVHPSVRASALERLRNVAGRKRKSSKGEDLQ